MLTVAALTAPPWARRTRPRSWRAFRSLRIVTSDVLNRRLRSITATCPFFSSSSRILVLRSRLSISQCRDSTTFGPRAALTNESKRNQLNFRLKRGVVSSANRACDATECCYFNGNSRSHRSPLKTIEVLIERLEYRRSCLSDAAADDDDLRIE